MIEFVQIQVEGDPQRIFDHVDGELPGGIQSSFDIVDRRRVIVDPFLLFVQRQGDELLAKRVLQLVLNEEENRAILIGEEVQGQSIVGARDRGQRRAVREMSMIRGL